MSKGTRTIVMKGFNNSHGKATILRQGHLFVFRPAEKARDFSPFLNCYRGGTKSVLALLLQVGLLLVRNLKGKNI